ncbi:hypothetical protein MWH25_03760 [Natroniella acetigena]|uniref:hypothetical protein n=1 Tax=Natroniella acetigena TaxID=52004 RepID=UPI00200AD8A6|nr:hypothetical protein [Natroniella acetigena]MCK8826863.1 hypothetical protein [Natroniella acetigena]
MKVSLWRMILAGIPESLLLAYVSLGLVGVKTEVKGYLKVGIAYTSGMILLRYVFQFHGLHSLLLILLLMTLLKLIVKVDLKLAVIGVLLVFIILFIIEAIIFFVIINYAKIDWATINNSLFLKLLLSYLQQLPLLMIALLIHFFDFKFSELADVDHV